MTKPISTRTHGILDYLTVGAMLAFPRLFNCSEPFSTCLTSTALTKLGWVIFTRHELGLVKVLPMKVHLALDCIGGAGVAALPFAVDEEDPAAIAFCVGMGLTDLVVAGLTETTPSFDKPQYRGQRPKALPRGQTTAQPMEEPLKAGAAAIPSPT